MTSEEMNLSCCLMIFLLVLLLLFIYFQYLKFSQISILRHQCQLTREKLNQIHLSTDALDQEYYQLKQLLSSSSMNDHSIGQRLMNLENEQRKSLIDQQRIHSLEHLNRQVNKELNTAKLVNESFRRRLNFTSPIHNRNNSMTPKLRSNRSFSPWPFPPWMRFQLPGIPEHHPLQTETLPK